MNHICTSYADKKDRFHPSLQSLPLETASVGAKKLARYKEDALETSQTSEAFGKEAESMSTVHDLCAVVIKLVTNSKTSMQYSGAAIRRSAIPNSLDDSEWGNAG